jgi:hypothetical protein
LSDAVLFRSCDNRLDDGCNVGGALVIADWVFCDEPDQFWVREIGASRVVS